MKIEITELRWREQKIIIANQNKKDSPLAYCGILMKIFLLLHNVTYVLLNLTGKKTAVDVTSYL